NNATRPPQSLQQMAAVLLIPPVYRLSAQPPLLSVGVHSSVSSGFRAQAQIASARRSFEALDPYLKYAPRYEAAVASLTHNSYLTHSSMRPGLLPEKYLDANKARRTRRCATS